MPKLSILPSSARNCIGRLQAAIRRALWLAEGGRYAQAIPSLPSVRSAPDRISRKEALLVLLGRSIGWGTGGVRRETGKE